MNLLARIKDLHVGLYALRRRNWHTAAKALSPAAEAFPNAWLWLNCGHALKEDGRYAEALLAYRKAAAARDGSWQAHFHMAEMLNRLGRADEAKKSAGRALSLSPEPVHHLLILLSQKLFIDEPPTLLQDKRSRQRRDAALRQLQEALALQPDDKPRRFMLGLHHWIHGEREQAEAITTALMETETWNEQVNWLYRRLKVDKIRVARASAQAKLGPAGAFLPDALHFVAIGTTGLCNASCVHCPTGKAVTAHVPRLPMPMPLFTHIIEQIAELGLSINDQLSFGLFGDGLVDPLVIERVRIARRLLPDARLSVNTNGAAYNRAKHKILAEMGVRVSLHIESMVPETYAKLMAPLRLERVVPKVEQLIEDFGEELYVSVPVSRANQNELPDILRYFYDRNILKVGLDGLSSRCASDRSVFDSLALGPVPIRCSPNVVNDLIVDSDGLVMICCQDFERVDSIGDLSKEALAGVLTNMARRKVHEQFANGRHEELQTCSRCFGDPRIETDHYPVPLPGANKLEAAAPASH